MDDGVQYVTNLNYLLFLIPLQKKSKPNTFNSSQLTILQEKNSILDMTCSFAGLNIIYCYKTFF